MDNNNRYKDNSNEGKNSQGFGHDTPPLDFDSLLPNEQKAKRIFSRTHLALFIYTAVCYASLIAIEIILSLALGAEKYLSLATNPVFSLLLSSICQYGIAFPVFLIASRGIYKSKDNKKSKMKLTHLLGAFLACQALMMIGNAIGLTVNGIVEIFTGASPENSVDTLVMSTPVWLLILVVVIIAPIIEELMLRKVMIDRLSAFGDMSAIIFSAAAFGFFHGNLYQIFYAFLIGLVLGYVYTVTRDVRYTIFLHMLLNFLGSVVAIYVTQAMDRLVELEELRSNGAAVNALEYALSMLITYGYSILQAGLFCGGVCVLILFFRFGGMNTIRKTREIYIPSNKIFSTGILNIGALMFYIMCFVLIGINLFSAVIIR